MYGLPTNIWTSAEAYLERGWFVVPLCWPDHTGHCGCGVGRGHAGREGKVPLIKGYQHERAEPRDLARWAYRWPGANLGILLDPSGLLVVDLDGPAAIEEAKQRGLPDTLRVRTRKGYHHYYNRPKGWPTVRLTQRGTSEQIDLLSTGFVVAPPSYHRSGFYYAWDNDWEGPLPDPPRWVRDFMPPPGWMVPHRVRELARLRARGSDPNETERELLEAALEFLEPDSYDLWLHVGFALRHWDEAGNGEGRGFLVWDQWSSRGATYPGTQKLREKWRSFGKKNGVGLGTVYAKAKDAGFDFQAYREGKTRNLGFFRGTWKSS